MARPFKVYKTPKRGWVVYNRVARSWTFGFQSPAAAADHIHKHWPWWP